MVDNENKKTPMLSFDYSMLDESQYRKNWRHKGGGSRSSGYRSSKAQRERLDKAFNEGTLFRSIDSVE